MKIAIASLLSIALAACQPTRPGPQADPAPAQATEEQAPASPAASQLPTPDTCDAKTYGWLLGENRSRVPAAPEGKVIRVVCSTCAMTMDYSESRLNVIFLEKTGLVQKLTCG